MRALIADFGGVITLDFYEGLRSFARREGLHEDAFIDAIRKNPAGKQLLFDVESGTVTQHEFQRGIALLLGVSDENLVARVLRDIAPDDAMIAAMDRLRRSGVRCGILSNSWGTTPFDPYAPYQLEQHWDAVIYSHEVGLRKPSEEIYLLAAHRLGFTPSECVFIDDTPDNLPVAGKLGMTTIHHSDAASTIHRLEGLFSVPLSGPNSHSRS